MEKPIRVKLPQAYKLADKIKKKLDYFKDKSTNAKILKWAGMYPIKNLFYVYLFNKYKSKCLIYRQTSKAPQIGIDIWASENMENTQKEIFQATAKQIAQCVKRGEKTVIIPTSLKFSDGAHANILIYRENGSILEHFEPHGQYMHNNSAINRPIIDKKLQDFLEILNTEFSAEKLPKVSFKSASDICPNIKGLQTLETVVKNTILDNGESETGGYCLAWCMFFTELCLKNPNVSSTELFESIYNTFSQGRGKNITLNTLTAGTYLRSVIRGYVHFISEKIDKYFSILFKGTLNLETIMKQLNEKDKETIKKLNIFLTNILDLEMKHLGDPHFKIEDEIAKIERIYELYKNNPTTQAILEDQIHLYKNFDKLIDVSPISIYAATPMKGGPMPSKIINPLLKTCPEGKVLNEKTGRCINIKPGQKSVPKPAPVVAPVVIPKPAPVVAPVVIPKPAPIVAPVVIPKPAPVVAPVVIPKPAPAVAPKNKTVKKCPEGKILNEQTGRCIKINQSKKVLQKILAKEAPKPAPVIAPVVAPIIIPKEVPKPAPVVAPVAIAKPAPKFGQITVPMFGQVVVPKPAQPDVPNKPEPPVLPKEVPKPVPKNKTVKTCPEGKILNEQTGRCIKIKNKTVKK
jgi:hypothetical protein